MQSKQRVDFQGRRRQPWTRPQGLEGVLARWQGDRPLWSQICLDHHLPAQAATLVPLPDDVPEALRAALAARGITALYRHQAEAFQWAEQGHSWVVATPTASGKSLAFHLPVLARLAREPGSCALYLYPTKALARDQEESLRQLLQAAKLPQGAITFDGDTPADARKAAKQRAGLLITNPDMLHGGILPHHTDWARVFAQLHYVIVDEVHSYRGVFGSHVAGVMRRLQRVARFHGSDPVFLCASATIGNPAEHAARLVGKEMRCIAASYAPVGPRRVLVYNPPIVNEALGLRASALKSAVRLAGDLLQAEVPTLLFGQSRGSVEVMLKYLRERVSRRGIDGRRIFAYRGGYLPQERRAIEAGLRRGEILGVVATRALELGIDIGSLDAVICNGYPGTLAGLWQRFGRAGRRQSGSLAVLVTSSAPVDQYLAQQADLLTHTPVEHAHIDPDNPEIFLQHLKCAAFELPFASPAVFGDVPAEDTEAALGYLSAQGLLYRSPDAAARYHWVAEGYPASHVSLRSAGWDNFVVIDQSRDAVLAEMDWRSTHTQLHEQAIYQHDNRQYQVERLDFDNHKAFVRPVDPDYFTEAITYSKVSILEAQAEGKLGPPAAGQLDCGLGDVQVQEKVIGYKKIKYHSHENVGYGSVHLPEMNMHSVAFWMTVPEALMQAQDAPRPLVIAALRGLGHALHTLAALGLMVDRRDLGFCLGDRNAPDVLPAKDHSSFPGPHFDPTLFFYDQNPGGVGLAPRLFDERHNLWQALQSAVRDCPCPTGCPACIGPEAGPQNNSARKHQAQALLATL